MEPADMGQHAAVTAAANQYQFHQQQQQQQYQQQLAMQQAASLHPHMHLQQQQHYSQIAPPLPPHVGGHVLSPMQGMHLSMPPLPMPQHLPAWQPAQPTLEKELADLQSLFGVQRECRWQYCTLDEIENSPSVKDGLSLDKQHQWRRQYLHLIFRAGHALKVTPWGIAAAAVLCHRFYTRRSMKRNDRFTIATACLHLAAKIQEGPKSIKDVVRECERVRLKNKPAAARINEPAYLDSVKEEVLIAERSVLYTLGFDLNAEPPHMMVLRMMGELCTTTAGDYKELIQQCWNFLNDSFRTTLCLQFPAEKIAAGIIWTADTIYRQQHKRGLAELIAARPGNQDDFFSYFKITAQEAQVISAQLMAMYAHIKLNPGEALTPVPPLDAFLDSQQGLPADGFSMGGIKRKVEDGAELGVHKVLKADPAMQYTPTTPVTPYTPTAEATPRPY